MSTDSDLQFANATFSPPANGAKSASNRPKKPMRSRKGVSQDYALVPAPWVPPTPPAKRELTEDEKRLRETYRRRILSRTQYLATRIDRPEQLNLHDIDVLAKQWEKDIWKKSIEQKGGDILNYENDFKAQLQMIRNCEENWNTRANEGLGCNGKDTFQSQVDAFLGDLSDNLEHRSQDGGVSFVRPSIHSGKEKD